MPEEQVLLQGSSVEHCNVPPGLGMMENETDTRILYYIYWGYVGIMKKNMETTIMGLYEL